jgi:hypothetical protein
VPGPVIAGADHLARLFKGAPHSTGAHCGRPGFGPNGHSRQVREREVVKSRGRHAQRAGREAHIKPGPQGPGRAKKRREAPNTAEPWSRVWRVRCDLGKFADVRGWKIRVRRDFRLEKSRKARL